MEIKVYGVSWLKEKIEKLIENMGLDKVPLGMLPIERAEIYLKGNIPRYCIEECAYFPCNEKCQLKER